jgi:hypothetical protein
LKVSFEWAAPAVGVYVRVVGVVSVEPAGLAYRRLMRTRKQADLSVIATAPG